METIAATTPLAVQLEHLKALADASLHLWDFPRDATARLINVSENVTFLVETGGRRAVLRIHREGYHSRRAIECELAWLDALGREGGVTTPTVIPGRDGRAIQSGRVAPLPCPRFMVMFDHIEGRQPDESDDLAARFAELGAIAARAHAHAIGWRRPQPFERLVWNLDAVFGPAPTWGRWRDGPNVTADIAAVLARVETVVTRRLHAFGDGPDRYGLIHADMRLANLIATPAGTRLIDFDDCGFSWFLYDFAAGVSFIEDDPRLPALREAWVEGYRTVRPLPDAQAREIDTLVMLRRLALLGWIGSHAGAPEPAALAPDFARVSAELGEAYLARLGYTSVDARPPRLTFFVADD